jgi:hypothetical protein
MRLKQSRSFDLSPRRIFLDTCTVQAISDCGNYVFGEDAFEDIVPSQITRRRDGAEMLHALRKIFLFDDRAAFDWIVSTSSIAETDRRRDRNQSSYIRDILDHSEIRINENPPDESAERYAADIDDRYFNFLSRSDRWLVQEAIFAGCDTFLTIENRLTKSSEPILRRVPLLIANPITLWANLEPHLAGL